MPDFQPTPEQVAAIAAATNSTDNLAIIARAGAAKTSTLILIAEALPDTKILCLAFNKKIAEEMQERLPKNCEAKTLHSLGYHVWKDFLGKFPRLSDRKVYRLTRAAIDKLQNQEERSAAFKSMAETMDYVREGKRKGWLPESYKGHWKPLIGDEEFYESLPMEPSILQMELIEAVSSASFRDALAGEIDFDDMIFCPALCSVSWPAFPLTLIDEAQDLSPLNHYILKKMVRKNRLIAVGDPCQAIYGFRGADTKSLENLSLLFDMRELYLTVSFRCGKRIIENARWRASDMKYPEWAVEGEVHRKLYWEADDIQPGDAIICRNNAPLFSMAIRMIEQDLLPEIAGRDIAAPLLKIMKKLGKSPQLSPAAIATLDDWREGELRRARNGAVGQINDRYHCIRIFLERTKTLGDAIAYLEHLVARDGRVYLMTGHKAKGLEFDRVWFLDQELCNKAHEQDANIKYVIETRAKEFLAYVGSKTFAGREDEDETSRGA